MARPELAAYLQTFRDASDAYWQVFKPKDLTDFRADGIGGTSWAAGTRWKPGLNDHEIAEIERRTGITFPPDYRTFLSILNVPDRPAHRFGYVGAKLEQGPDCHVFTDWQDSTLPKAYNDDVIDGILFDVEQNDVWFESWGARPAAVDARRSRVVGLANAAPKLIRLNGHRFLIEGTGIAPDPVISAVQTDFIIYAWSIEESLARDFPDFAVPEPVHPISEQAKRTHFEQLLKIEFWGELIN